MINLNEKYIVVDTETTNSLEDPLCYDVGFAVIDSFGAVHESYSFVVADVFLDGELMNSAYFKEKIPQYWEEINNGIRQLKRFSNIRKIFREVCKKYDINIIIAHNARFDYRSLNLTQRFLTKSKYRYFFPYGVEIWDTLKMARKILTDENYTSFCHRNNYVTERGCKRYTAEIIYRYLINDISFEESHTGLEDVLIEKEIFIYCINKDKEIDGKLW